MRRKRFRSYYSRLTFICILSVLCVVSLVSLFLLLYLHTDRIHSEKKNYESALQEIVQYYDDIWNDYYKAFIPLTKKDSPGLQLFFSKESSRYENIMATQHLEQVLEDICQQDISFTGVLFRRCSDNQCYIYFADKKILQKVSLDMKPPNSSPKASRTIIGGQTLGDFTVWGIQSQILSYNTSDTTTDYQITILYDMDAFDDILAKYNISAEARVLLTSQEGLVIYDNWGQYNYGQPSYYEYVSNITSQSEVFTQDHITYLKQFKPIKNNELLAFYIIPENKISNFQFDRTSGIILTVAAIITISILLVISSVNRLITQKFRQLEEGIQQIDQSNFKYRIDMGNQEDEFAMIAVHFNKMCDDLESMIQKNYVYQILMRNAEYKALQTTVNPHFLYNSLEAIREKLAINGQGNEAEMILLLSRIFEYQVRGKNVVTIQAELESLKNYIDFYSIRYQYTFQYYIDFEDDILDDTIPKHIFQPIMENYFQHGFRGDMNDCIRISGYINATDDLIHIDFNDNGKGIRPEKHKELLALLDKSDEDNTNIGLSNVHNRLKIAFGDQGQIKITPNEPEPGVCISLIFGRKLQDFTQET